jgi:hypothetical protein
MKRLVLIGIVLLFCLVPAQVGAVENRSGDLVVIDTPIDDDLFVTGGTITINAYINGDVVASGGTIEVNAPIKGDLLVVGGQITVNADIEGKIIAAGGMIDIKGKAEKVLAVGGTITFQSTAVIERYVFAAGGTVNNAGEIKEDFYVATNRFENTGIVGGTIEIEEPPTFTEELKQGLSILSILWKIGYLILGIFFIKLFGNLFFRIEEEVRESTIKKTVLGFILIIVTAVVSLVLAITIIGSPIAVILVMFFVMALMAAGLFVSYSLGDWLLKMVKVTPNDILAFVVGFIILNLLFVIPYVGFIVQVIAVSLGFGAIFYTIKDNWKTITAPKP